MLFCTAYSLWATFMRYWLMKSEPDEASIDHLALAPKKTLPWTGVRNYQARNFMRDGMQIGDGVLFYHSSCPQPGIAGIAKVSSAAYPDPTQFDSTSHYYDPKSSPEKPRWQPPCCLQALPWHRARLRKASFRRSRRACCRSQRRPAPTCLRTWSTSRCSTSRKRRIRPR